MSKFQISMAKYLESLPCVNENRIEIFCWSNEEYMTVLIIKSKFSKDFNFDYRQKLKVKFDYY